MSQTDMAEASGMTAVHVNRTLAEPGEYSIYCFTQSAVPITKLPELFQIS